MTVLKEMIAIFISIRFRYPSAPMCIPPPAVPHLDQEIHDQTMKIFSSTQATCHPSADHAPTSTPHLANSCGKSGEMLPNMKPRPVCTPGASLQQCDCRLRKCRVEHDAASLCIHSVHAGRQLCFVLYMLCSLPFRVRRLYVYLCICLSPHCTWASDHNTASRCSISSLS